MKFLLALSFILTTEAFALPQETLPFDETMEVKAVVMDDRILLDRLINLHQDFNFERERMLAGYFESKNKTKSVK